MQAVRSRHERPVPAGAALNLVNTIIGVAYYAYFEGARGQTIGKMVAGIKVSIVVRTS